VNLEHQTSSIIILKFSGNNIRRIYIFIDS
jgi:hypothetical protein